MKENIAIIIGVAEYGNCAYEPLPASLNDVDAMHDLLSASSRFTEIIPLKNATEAEILSPLKKLSGETEKIGDLFIYFSGHGTTIIDEFYWVPKDFSENSPQSTGISATTLISVLKEINATNTILVQDACNSGQALLKGQELRQPLPLESFLQFSSSLHNEDTPAGIVLSPYTDMFIEAASHAKNKGKIDYLDLTRKLKDILNERASPTHTPHYGFQGGLNVIFCEDATKLVGIREKYILPTAQCETETEIPKIPTKETLSDVEILTQATARMQSKTEVQSAIDKCFEGFIGAFSNHRGLTQHFSARTETVDGFYKISNEKQIVQIIKRRGQWDDFVTATATRKKVKKNRMLGQWASTHIYEMMYGAEYKTEYRLDLNATLSNVHQLLFIEPTEVILRRHVLEIAFIPGIFDTTVFWRLGKQGLSDWDEFSDDIENSEWSYRASIKKDTDFGWLYENLFKQAEISLDRTVNNLRKDLDVE